MDLSERHSLIVAILVLFLGKFLNKKISFFRDYNIPEPVTGGVLASVLFAIVYLASGISVEFSLISRDALLLIFFTCIGLSSNLQRLIQGGKPLVILLLLAVVYLLIQNFIGIGIAYFTGLIPEFGILGGSVSLSGGHGTAIAWAPVFESDYNLSSAPEIGIACATFGLVLGGIVGGPIAKRLIHIHKLSPGEGDSYDEAQVVGVPYEKEAVAVISYESMIRVIFIIAVAIGIGTHLNTFFLARGIELPDFVTCLFAGIILCNTVPYIIPGVKKTWGKRGSSLALVSDVSLGLFLAMSLMSLQLWTLADLAGPVALILVGQLIGITIYSMYVVFPLLGKSYDAAVIAAGYAGLALGATPTAIVNMTAVTKRFGPSPISFIVIPLIGAFFIDISNAIIIRSLLDWLQ